jgi:sphingolipid delta-4 desaturase
MSATSFTYTQTGEPHTRRRVEILARHPGIRALAGHDPNTAWVTLFVVIAQLGLAFAVSTQPWWVIAGVAYLAGAVLMHWLAMAIHESSHNLVFRSRMTNKAIALFANIPCVIWALLMAGRFDTLAARCEPLEGAASAEAIEAVLRERTRSAAVAAPA